MAHGSSRQGLSVFFLLLLIAAVACGAIVLRQQEARRMSEAVAAHIVDEEQLRLRDAVFMAGAHQVAAAAALPVEAFLETQLDPAHPPPPAGAMQELRLVKQGFGQKGTAVGYGLIVENPNPRFAVEDARFHVTFYDAGGALLKSDAVDITRVLPGQSLGIGGTIILADDAVVEAMEVQLGAGEAVPMAPQPGFGVRAVTVFANDFGQSVTAVIENPYERDHRDLRVSAVTYDAAGEIAGGGHAYVDFVPARGSTGVQIDLDASRDHLRVEVYPTFTLLSIVENREAPDDALPPVVQKSGFGQEGFQVGYGLLLQNPNQAYLIDSLQYRVTAYASDGTVLGAAGGFAPLLLPSQVVGFAALMFLEDDRPVERLQVSLSGGVYEAADPQHETLRSEGVALLSGGFLPEVTGSVHNPYGKELANVHVSALGFDAAGEIIGGGDTTAGFIPANGQAAVLAYLIARGTPVRVELYANLDSRYDID
jgi:hypothetical protein